MQWVKIELKIPQDIIEIYEEIIKIQPNSCIAGGCLSDLYMGCAFKDIDIFIKVNKEKQKQIETLFVSQGAKKIKESKISSAYAYKIALDVKTYIIGNKEVQLIFTPFGITATKYFDYRFREFFYFRNQSYASKEALADIQNKKLVFGVTKAPLVALLRAAKFKSRYGFEIEEQSFTRFKKLFNAYLIPEYAWLDFIKSVCPTKQIRKELQNISPMPGKKKVMEYDVLFEDMDWMYHLKNRHFKRDQVEAVESLATPIETFLVTFEQNPFENELIEKKEEIIQAFKKIRIQLAIHRPDIAQQWTEYVENIEEQSRDWFTELVQNAGESLKYQFTLIGACMDYIEIKQLTEKLKPRMKLEIHHNHIWKGGYHYSIHRYLQGKYVKVQLEDFKEFVFEKKSLSTLFSNMHPYIREKTMKKIRQLKVYE